MALVLVRLRLLIARRNRGGGLGASTYYFGSWVVGVLFGAIIGLTNAVFASSPGFGDALLLGTFVTVFLPWIFGPVLEPTLADGTIDPRRLEQFSLSRTQQLVGLLLGALISPTAAFTALVSLGAIAGLGLSTPSRLAGLVAALCFTVMCVAVSRGVQALLFQSLHTRRGRDIAALLASMMVLGLYAASVHLRTTIESLNDQLAGPLGQFASWTPPGSAAQAIIDARADNWGGYVLHLVVVLATTALAMVGWGWALERGVRGDLSGLNARRRAVRENPTPLQPSGIALLPPSVLTAAMSQQWRYFFFRSPKAIQTLIIPPVMGIMVAHTAFGGLGTVAQAAAFSALAVVVGSFNIFGYDGVGFRYLLDSGTQMSQVLLGKALTPLLYLVPLLIGFSGVEGFLNHDPASVPMAIIAGLGVFAVGIGIGTQSSIFNPSDQSRVGHRQGTFLKVFAWFSGFFVVVLAGAFCWSVFARHLGLVATAIILSSTALLVAVVLVRGAGRRVDADPYDLLRRLNPAG